MEPAGHDNSSPVLADPRTIILGRFTRTPVEMPRPAREIEAIMREASVLDRRPAVSPGELPGGR